MKKTIAYIYHTARREAYCSLCGEDLRLPYPKKCPCCKAELHYKP